MNRAGMPAHRAGGASGMGTVSIFCILVVCCLSAFAILALVSAGADARLSQRNADLVAATYRADTRAEELLADLAAARRQGADDAAMLQLLAGEGVSKAAVAPHPEGRMASFSVAVGDEGIMALHVALLLPGDSGAPIVRQRWQLQTDESGDVYDNSLEVWTP